MIEWIWILTYCQPDVFVITINDTNPIWFYCSQGVPAVYTHCAYGMVGVINPP